MDEGIPLMQSYDKKQYFEFEPPKRKDIDSSSNKLNDGIIQQEIELEILEFQDGVRSMPNEFRSHGETFSDSETEKLMRIKYPPKIAVTSQPFEQAQSKYSTKLKSADCSGIDATNLRHSQGSDKIKSISSMDEFNLHHVALSPTIVNKAMKTGRQRKRIAARSKGGEFQARRRKRRVYFCCIGSEIDVEKLVDRFLGNGITCKLYDEVLHICIEKDLMNMPQVVTSHNLDSVTIQEVDESLPLSRTGYSEYVDPGGTLFSQSYDSESNAHHHPSIPIPAAAAGDSVVHHHQSGISNQREVFVFGFGAVVFWGFPRGEEAPLLEAIRGYIEKGLLSAEEFQHGEDDMAFVTAGFHGGDDQPPSNFPAAFAFEGIVSPLPTEAMYLQMQMLRSEQPSSSIITIANDVISVPENSSVKSRLAVSFAIAQSAVLAVFEARIERKIEEYKYIPEMLAKNGKVRLSPKQLGTMIGEVFVIRHDVNLHSEILDKPDFFWKENEVEPMYRMCMQYLEMEPRTEVLNKRLDLLRELLSVLQQQHENAHNVKLEWIIIWLIVISVVLELWVIAWDIFGSSAEKHR